MFQKNSLRLAGEQFILKTAYYTENKVWKKSALFPATSVSRHAVFDALHPVLKA
jgi:hypothetical protein